MKTITKQDEAEMKQQVCPWMEKRRLPLVLFDKLKPHNKLLLHNIVCVGTKDPSHAQLIDLWDDLGLREGRGEGYYPTDGEMRKYLSPDDDIPFLKKF